MNHITLDLRYKTKLIQYPIEDEQGLLVRVQFYTFRIRETPRIEHDIPEGRDVFQIKETSITIPSVCHYQTIPEFRSEGFRKYCIFLEKFLLNLCERDLKYHIENQLMEKHIKDFEFDFNLIKDETDSMQT